MLNIFNKKLTRIYFDHASATPILDLAKESFVNATNNFFANSSSIHLEGEKSREALFEARKKIAKIFHTKSNNIFFTSSTTESNNIFIKGYLTQPLLVKERRSAHVIYSTSDHSAIVEVVESFYQYPEDGPRGNIVPNKIGILKTEDIINSLRENTKLICFSYVNSETGTIQDVKKIVQEVKRIWQEKFQNSDFPKFFIDASQAVKYFEIDFNNLGIDGLSVGISKLGGVPGCSVLIVKPDTKLSPLISGGGQEEGVRSGTENLPAILSAQKVLEYICNPKKQNESREKVYELRNYMIDKLDSTFREGGLEIFGDTKFKYNKYFEHSAPHILLISLVDMLGEELALRLDAKGISVSPGTACSLLENSGSNFLKSIGELVQAKEVIRISFDETNTKKEIDYFVQTLKEIKDKFIK